MAAAARWQDQHWIVRTRKALFHSVQLRVAVWTGLRKVTFRRVQEAQCQHIGTAEKKKRNLLPDATKLTRPDDRVGMMLQSVRAFALWIAPDVGRTLPRPAVAEIVAPFMRRIPNVSPAVSRHRMSDMPSPLKSPVSATLQMLGTLPTPAVAETVVLFMRPDPDVAGGGHATECRSCRLAIEVAASGSNDRPVGGCVRDNHR